MLFDLPPLPSAHHHIALFGVLVTVPDSWNLQLYRGDEKRGLLVLADLRQNQLEIRWQTPRVRYTPPPTGWHLAEGRGHFMAACGKRLFELTPHPAVTQSQFQPLANAFITAMTPLEPSPDWPWILYGVSAWLPKSARLLELSLLPGATRLTFRHGKTRLQHGSFSIADRLLQNQSLQQFAQKTFPNLAPLSWSTTPSQCRAAGLLRRPFYLPKRRHDFTLTHDAAANRLTWSALTSPPR